MENIKLIKPENGSVTAPLQKYNLPTESVPPASSSPQSHQDRSFPQAVTFIWEAVPTDKTSVTYDLLISREPDFNDSLTYRNLPEPKAEVLHLHIATRYFWKVVAKSAVGGGGRIAESPTWSFTTNSATPRWIWAPWTTNVRDLGGWRITGDRMVRQGALYRSAKMDGSVQITEKGKSVLIHDLGIRTELDFRGKAENPYPVLDENKVQWINVPIGAYEQICDPTSQLGYRKIFEFFADASKHPILFHCWGGADRAGTVAFLLNALLGVKLEHLIHDYELTSLSIWGVRSRSSENFKNLINALAPFGNKEDNFMEKAENYLLSIGVARQTIAAIRAQLIVDCKGI